MTGFPEQDRKHLEPDPNLVSWSPNTITLEGMRIDPGDVVQFLAVLSVSGNVAKSCRVSRISRATIYRMVERIPEFRTAFQDALDQAPELLEEEAYRRAVTGVVKPVFFAGKVVGAVREYSDKLLQLMLQARHPAYKNIGQVNVTQNTSTIASAAVERDVGPPIPESIDLLAGIEKLATLGRELLSSSRDDENASAAG